jgi:hypothetical protein
VSRATKRLCPNPGHLDRVIIVKLSDGETVLVRGEHREIAQKLARSS